jgi:uncharacterized protein (UPF0128 family)
MKILFTLFLFIHIHLICSADEFLVSYKLVKTDSKKSISSLWKKHKIPRLILPVKNVVDI